MKNLLMLRLAFAVWMPVIPAPGSHDFHDDQATRTGQSLKGTSLDSIASETGD